jgi:hypothetical protein
MGFVYILNIKNTDYYKIGRTSGDINKRIKKIQTGSPRELILISYYKTDISPKIESYLHRIYKHKKFIESDFEYLTGEWFNLLNEDIDSFQELCSKVENNIKSLKKIF